ncbi:MAG: HlyD family efflux transporter periplasmic adaptor subunit [Bacteroidetes bacterium]|nr:HlyD family efflux transporter periplasmic adaptor subunit [Bacteroidota bacterium]
MAKKKRNNTLLYVLLGVVALLIVWAVIKSQNRVDGTKVSSEVTEKRTIIQQVSASGKIFPVTEVQITSDVSGEVVELFVEEGDSVIVGQLLAKVDPDAYESQVERGEATVNNARANQANAMAQVESLTAQKEQIQAQLDNARDIFNRNKKLYEEGVISEADFDLAKSNLEALEANLRSSEASIRSAEQSARAAEYTVSSTQATLKELRTNLKRTTLYAPIDGIVSSLSIEKGERVVGTIQMSGTELMRIADLNAMEVQVEVSENDIPNVALGNEVDIEVDAYIGRTFKGTVSQIANSASNTTGAAAQVSLVTDQVTNFIVTIDINQASYKDLITAQKPYPFRPGMSASVEIYTQTLKDVLSVPIQSVGTRERDDEGARSANTLTDNIEEVVFVVSADSVNQVTVTTGIQDDDYIQVLSGLSGGEEVVTGPYDAVSRELEQGSEVTVVDKDDLYKEE